MSQTWQLISVDNPVFSHYALWTGALVLKTLLMSMLTGLMRFKNFTFINKEDAAIYDVAVKHDDDEVERVRRAHRNDLENVVPLVITGFIYVLTDPPTKLAMQLYQAAALFRIGHSIVYAVWIVPQPARAIAFFGPWFVTVYMACKVMEHFW